MKLISWILTLALAWVPLAAGEYKPLGVPFVDATITFSSVNKSVSYPGVPGVAFPRFPLPSGAAEGFFGGPGFHVWHSEVGLPQWIKIQLKKPIQISQFAFTGRLSFEDKIKDDKRGKTHYRLEAVNPNVAVAGEAPSCTVGWKTLAEEDDADHFTFLGDDRKIQVDDQEAYSCFRLFFPEFPMDNDCRHLIIVSDIEMTYAQSAPPTCRDEKPCKCLGSEAAFMGPDRKFVSWQMYHDDYNEQILSYTFPSGETVFGFEFKTDKSRPQDGPTTYELTGKNEGGAEVLLFKVVSGPLFTSGSEVRRHRFEPPKGKTFETFYLRVKKAGWMEAKVGPGITLDGWVQVRDVKFYVTRTHQRDVLTGDLV